MNIEREIRKFEYEFDIKAERFVWHHPFLGFLAVFIVIPVIVLACVCMSTAIITFPIIWALGLL